MGRASNAGGRSDANDGWRYLKPAFASSALVRLYRSHSHRKELGCIFRATQIGVKDHRHVSDENASQRGELDLGAMDRQQALSFQFEQVFELGLEIIEPIDSQIDPEVTHQISNHRPAAAIVVRQ